MKHHNVKVSYIKQAPAFTDLTESETTQSYITIMSGRHLPILFFPSSSIIEAKKERKGGHGPMHPTLTN